MTRSNSFELHVEFGDCDPAQIAYFPNFFRWADAASRRFFEKSGLPNWRDAKHSHGIIGTPCVSAEARFIAPATYGDVLQIESRITEWREKSFVFQHMIRRGRQEIAEIKEVRVFASETQDSAKKLRAVSVPPEWRALCK